MLSYALISAPTAEPVTVAEVKRHSRISTADDDLYIETLIEVARKKVESDLNRQIMTATYDLFLDWFPPWNWVVNQGSQSELIKIPKPPLQSVTSISYVDTEGITQVLPASDYVVEKDTEPGQLWPAYGKVWPLVRDQRKAITIRFLCGYASVALVPGPIKHLILLLAAHLYEHREPIITGTISVDLPMSYTDLLWSQRVPEFA